MRSKSYDLISDANNDSFKNEFCSKIEDKSSNIYKKNNIYAKRKELATNDFKRAVSYLSLARKVENNTSNEVSNLNSRSDYRNSHIKTTSTHGKCNSKKLTKIKCINFHIYLITFFNY